MFKILIDTCVWLDLAKDPNQQPLLDILEELIDEKKVSLIVPRTIVTEFHRNKDRIIKESGQSLSGTFKRVKEAVGKFSDPKKRKKILEHLDDIDHKIPLLGEAATESVTRITKLLSKSTIIEATPDIKLKAAQRAIDKKAPFHRQRNSIEDAIIIETYISILKDKSRFIFITHNVKDFSVSQGDVNLPHPDIASSFSKIKSLYFIKLSDALHRIEPSRISERMREQEFIEEPRTLTEIGRSIGELIDKVWYNRHQNLKYKIEKGLIKVVPKDTPFDPKTNSRVIRRDILDGALKSAKRVEKLYGLDELGPWDDFEWGMINGKLSALRWVLGDDWDMLDT